MAINPDVLKKELAEVTRGLEEALREKQAAERKHGMMEAKRQALVTLLGDEAEKPSAEAKVAASDSLFDEATPSKRSLIRQELQNAGAGGARPATIYNALKSKGIKRAYVHSTLGRMKESGEASERNGKYAVVQLQ